MAARVGEIAFALELGSGMGHLSGLLPLAEFVRQQGGTPHWMVPRPSDVATTLRQHHFSWFQSPAVANQRPGQEPLNYAGILLHFGYGRFDVLLGLVEAWWSLLKAVRADVVVVDHAPTALLAARTLGIPAVTHGTGFTIPPNRHPTPTFRPWRKDITPEQLLANDVEVLSVVNPVLAEFGCTPLQTVAELFNVAVPGLLTIPALDPFAGPGRGPYWGLPTPGTKGGKSPEWPEATGKRLFAYVRSDGGRNRNVLAALAMLASQTDCSMVVVAPGVPPDEQVTYRRTNLQVAEHLLSLPKCVEEADWCMVAGGGVNTASHFLVTGKLVVILPDQIEAFLVGKKAQSQGAPVVLVDPGLESGALCERLQKALEPDACARSSAEHAGVKAMQGAIYEPERVFEQMAPLLRI